MILGLYHYKRNYYYFGAEKITGTFLITNKYMQQVQIINELTREINVQNL